MESLVPEVESYLDGILCKDACVKLVELTVEGISQKLSWKLEVNDRKIVGKMYLEGALMSESRDNALNNSQGSCSSIIYMTSST